jgi:2-keto-3-deoxy-L-rhamnonate aldolase RhmA
MSFQKMLREKEFCYGMFINIPDPAIVEIAKYAGIDFIRLDWEHKLIGSDELREMVRTATLLDLPVQVRVPQLTDVTALLDAGVASVLIPGITSAQTAQEAVNEAKYYPLGLRGISGDSRAIRYGHDALNPYLNSANDESVMLGVQIEQKQAFENIDEILSRPGIDIVVTGRNDLSQSFGLLGDPTNPFVMETEKTIIQKAIACQKQPMILASDAKRVSELRELGVRLIIVTQDSKVLFQGLKRTLSDIKE